MIRVLKPNKLILHKYDYQILIQELSKTLLQKKIPTKTNILHFIFVVFFAIFMNIVQ